MCVLQLLDVQLGLEALALRLQSLALAHDLIYLAQVLLSLVDEGVGRAARIRRSEPLAYIDQLAALGSMEALVERVDILAQHLDRQRRGVRIMLRLIYSFRHSLSLLLHMQVKLGVW